MSGDLASMIKRLLELQPDTTEAENEQHAIEHELMGALGTGGARVR